MDHPRTNCSYSGITYARSDGLDQRTADSGLTAGRGRRPDDARYLRGFFLLSPSARFKIVRYRCSGKNEAVSGIEYYLFKIDYLFNWYNWIHLYAPPDSSLFNICSFYFIFSYLFSAQSWVYANTILLLKSLVCSCFTCPVLPGFFELSWPRFG